MHFGDQVLQKNIAYVNSMLILGVFSTGYGLSAGKGEEGAMAGPQRQFRGPYQTARRRISARSFESRCSHITPLILIPNPPKGVVEMAEQGIRDPEERLSR